jgi:hypothetical protein
MGHPLAPSILKRLAQQVAEVLHREHDVAMVSYLDDWLIFGRKVPAQQIVRTITRLGLTINTEKSHLTPTSKLVYLGLNIDLPRQTLQATPAYISHLLELLSILPKASSQDIR